MARNVNGPYDIINLTSDEPVPIGCRFPFREVAGATLGIVLEDNFANALTPGNISQADVVIVGIAQGIVDYLKRDSLHRGTGSMSMLVQYGMTYEEIEIRARNMSGGIRMPTAAQPAAPPPFDGNHMRSQFGFFMNLTVFLTPAVK